MEWNEISEDKQLLIKVLESMTAQVNEVVNTIEGFSDKLNQSVNVVNLKKETIKISKEIEELYRYYDKQANKEMYK